MNRRRFIALAGLIPLVGCRPKSSSPAEQRLTASDRQRMATEAAAREQHVAMLANFRVPADAVRTTPPRPVDVLKVFPELLPRVRVAVRLHPRAGTEPGPAESKLAGQFLWPVDEPWPECERFKIPLVPVLQLKRADAPPTVLFFPGTDLLQLLWSPRDHDGQGPKPKIVWRSLASVQGNLLAPPETSHAFPSFVPLPCRLFPERVSDFPDAASFPDTALRTKLESWKPEQAGVKSGLEFYKDGLSAAPGTKVGGYPRWAGENRTPSCDTCKWGMDFLLTVDSHEWGGNLSWIPIEESKATPATGYATANGLTLPVPGNLHLFVCHRCTDWPVKGAH